MLCDDDERRLCAGLEPALAPVTMRLRSAKYRSRSRNWQEVLPASQASQRVWDLIWTHLIFFRRLCGEWWVSESYGGGRRASTHQLSHEVTSRGRFLCVCESCGASSTKRRPSMKGQGIDYGWGNGRIFGKAWASVFKRLCEYQVDGPPNGRLPEKAET